MAQRSSALTAMNCVFENNNALLHGGAIEAKVKALSWLDSLENPCYIAICSNVLVTLWKCSWCMLFGKPWFSSPTWHSRHIIALNWMHSGFEIIQRNLDERNPVKLSLKQQMMLVRYMYSGFCAKKGRKCKSGAALLSWGRTCLKVFCLQKHQAILWGCTGSCFYIQLQISIVVGSK